MDERPRAVNSGAVNPGALDPGAVDLHHGVHNVLSPPTPSNPLSLFFLAFKAAVACALVLVIDGWTGNPDHVSSTFVAVVSVSPVVAMGIRRSFQHAMGGVIGGLWGGLGLWLGLDLVLGIPLAVGLTILTARRLGFDHVAASFTALFVQAVPFGGPAETLGVRFLAIGTATLSAFVANLLVSAVAYRSIFQRRLRFAEATVSALLTRAAEEGPSVARQGFPVLSVLEDEIEQARGELRLRRSRETEAWLGGLAERAANLRRLLHLVLDLVYRLEEEKLPPDAMQDWLRWLVHAGGEEPTVTPALRPTTQRIRALGQTLR